MEIQKVSCDVLCVGGGIAGLMAAIEATENGAKNVVVAEKANTERSGAGGMGNDHFQCYVPDIHGDYNEFAKDLLYGQMGPRVTMLGKENADFWFKNTYDIIILWDSWGVPMKYEGKYEFAGHSFPGQILNHLKYSGKDQKKVLTKKAKEHGVKIINRVMIYELLTDNNRVIGALGISTREDRMFEFEAKTVILGTGTCTRLYPGPTLHDFNRHFPGTNTADGRAMAYRAGAELINIELTRFHTVPKYFSRAGQATWIGVLKDRSGKPVGPFLTEPNRYYNDMTIEANKGIVDDYKKSGKGPVYMDGRGMSDEDHEYVKHWMNQEGNQGLLQHLKEERIDLRKNPIEFMSSEMTSGGGIPYNSKGETSVKGLYAAGDELFGGISCAAVFGRSAGKNAANHAETLETISIENVREFINNEKTKIEEIRKRKDAPKWKEANAALNQIMRDYADKVRCEDDLQAGLENIERLKNRAHERLMADNSHELMHCLEVLNLIDIGQVLFVSAIDRKETRGITHIRPDYPITNPMLGKRNHFARKGLDFEIITEWR